MVTDQGLYQDHFFLQNFFIDDIDEEVLSEISKFADYTKITILVNTLKDIKSMQKTLEKLVA